MHTGLNLGVLTQKQKPDRQLLEKKSYTYSHLNYSSSFWEPAKPSVNMLMTPCYYKKVQTNSSLTIQSPLAEDSNVFLNRSLLPFFLYFYIFILFLNLLSEHLGSTSVETTRIFTNTHTPRLIHASTVSFMCAVGLFTNIILFSDMTSVCI